MAVDQNNPQLLLPPPPFPSHSDFALPLKSTVSGSSTAITNMPNPLREDEEEEQVSWGSASSGSFLTESAETGDGTELDEEDGYVSELTRKMALYKFQDDDDDKHSDKKIWGLSGSPRSAVSGWHTTKLHHDEEHKLVCSVAAKNSNQALTDYQIRAIQFYKLKQEQVARKQSQGSGRQNGIRNPPKLQHLQNKENPKPSSSPNPWSPAHQHYPKSNQLQPPGSGMRAVFLGGPGSRSRSCGTGVFLPRGDRSNPSESRKKPGCSTVLIPARVAQALKLHFEQVGVVSRANTNNIVGNASDSLMQHDVGKNQDHKWHFETVPASKNHQYEMGLPQEWTY